MPSFMTPYGELKAVSEYTAYAGDRLKDCVVTERSELRTPLGLLTPQYEHAGIRRKHIYSVSFFPNGKISRISLNEQRVVETPIGPLPAELITFYESGGIKRLFPLNGQISGYWGEDDEYRLAGEFYFSLPSGSFKAKIISVYFYENGALRSLTFWPKETVLIKTPVGGQKVRTGLSLYPDGSVESFEPAVPVNVMTPIGLISSYDTAAVGISGDRNSLRFAEGGKLKALISSNTKITVTDRNNQNIKTYAPAFIKDMHDYEMFFQPLAIDFEDGKVRFGGRDEYIIAENRFRSEPYSRPPQSRCSDCSGCSRCFSDPQEIL
jgi:hypothetical protein